MAQNNRIQFSLDFAKGDTSALQGLKRDIEEIKKLASDIHFAEGLDDPKQLQSMASAAATLEKALNNAFDVDLNTYNIQKFNQILSQSGHNATTLQSALAQAGAVGQQAFLKATSQLMSFNNATKQTNKFLDSMATSFFNTVRWGAMSGILNNITGTVEKSVSYIKNLDTSLNDIRIVTGKSADEMSRFATEANNAAKELAVSTRDYTEGSLIYYQQGLDDKTVSTLTDITAKTSNVTGQNMEEVSEQLTAVWNGYQVANEAARDGMSVYEEYVDKMAAVGAATASDLEELSVAMSKVASAAKSMGVDFDDLNAQIATIVSVTRQAPESVGTALKTIYARLGDLEVDGVDEFGVSLGKVSGTLQKMGVDILDQTGNMRDMTSVIAEVAAKWDTWTEAQRQAAAVAMAGKRQYNNLIALFDNWDMYGKSLETSMNAAGTLEQQQEIALDSLQRKMKQLQATAEDFYDSLFDEGSIKDLVDVGTQGLQLLADFADAVGGLNGILPLLGSTAIRVFNNQIANGLGTVIINARNARTELSGMEQNAEQLRLLFADSSLFDITDDTGINDVASAQFDKLKAFYSEMQPYQQMMSQEEKVQYNLIRENIVKSGELAIEAQKVREEFKQTNNELKLIDGNLVNDTNHVGELAIQMSKVERIAQEIEDKGKNSSNLSWSNWIHFLKSFEDELKLTDEQVKILGQRFVNLGDNLTSAQKLKIIADELREIGAGANQVTTLARESERLAQATDKVGNSFAKNLNTKQQIANISNMIGAIGQLTMSINTLSNIGSILSNEDLSFGEKFLQTAMNLSFVLPMLGSSLDTLIGKMLQMGTVDEAAAAKSAALTAAKEAEKLQREANIATEEAERLQKEATIAINHAELVSDVEGAEAIMVRAEANAAAQKAEEASNLAKQKNILANQANTTSEELNTVAQQKNTMASEKNVLAKMKQIFSTISHKEAVEAETYALAMQKVALLGIVAVIGLAVGAYAIYNKVQEQAREEAREHAQESLEAAEAIKAQVDSNKDLVKSFEEVKKKYQEGNATKKELMEITNQLVNTYDLESSRLDVLVGNYDKVTEAIKKKQQAEQEELIKQQKQSIVDSTKSAVAQGRTADDLYKWGDSLQANIATESNFGGLSKEAISKFSDTFGDILSNGVISIDPTNTQQVLDFYQRLIDYKQTLIDLGEDDTSMYSSISNMVKALNKEGDMDTIIEQSKNLVESLLNIEDLENIANQVDFDKAVQAMRDKLQDAINNHLINLKTDEIEDTITNYLMGIDNDFIQTTISLDALKQKLQLTDEEFQKLQGWSDKDKEILLSGSIEFDGLKTEESLKKALESAKNQLTDEDLTVVASLRTKIASDKKLNKKELEEKAGEESTLMQDYDTELYDFDNQSELDQVDILNNIVNQKIEANQRYITNAKEVAEEEKEILEERKENLETELENLQNKQMAPGVELTDEEKERYDELINDILPALEDKISEVQEVAENGLGFDEINEINFDNLITGIDGVITEADVLKDLAEEIGENWTIAAGDLEEVALNFPELLQAQENYNTLQDGSVQLTEQGRVALQGLVAERKNQLIAENEAYQIELQKQADLQYAAADYYAQQAQYIQDYLNNKSSAAEAEQNMEKAVKDYENKVIEITAGNDKKAKQAMSANLAAVTSNAQTNLKNQYDMWCSVGEAIAAAAMAETSGHFRRPGFNGAGGVSTSLTDMQSEALPSSNDSIFSSKAAAQTAYQNLKKREAEARNQGDQLLAKKAVAQSGTNAALNAMNNAASGKGGKGSSSKGGKGKKGGGSGKEKEKEKKEFEDEIDRYYDLNRAIEKTSRSLERLDKIKETLRGKNLTKALKEENKLLKQQQRNYTALIKEQKKEAKEEQAKLKGTFKLKFNKDGSIKNYADIADKEQKRMVAATDKYNKSKQTDKDKKEYENAEKRWKAFEDRTKKYTDLIDNINDNIDKRAEIRAEKIKAKFEAFDNKLQVKLDKRAFDRDTKELSKILHENIQSAFKNYSIEIDYNSDLFKSRNKDISNIISQINQTKTSIDKMEAGKKSKKFNTVDEAQKYLEELYSSLSDAAKEMKQAYEEAWNAYLDELDQAANKFDIIQDKFNSINDELDYQRQLIELIYGENAYELMDSYYEAQHEANLNRIASLRTESQAWQQQLEERLKENNHTLENMFEWDEDEKKYYENWQKAQSSMKEEIINDIKAIQDQYINSINTIMNNMEKELTGGALLADVETQWERISEEADKYYDSVEKTYQIQTLSNKMEKDIIATSNLKTQQKLQKLREKEIKELREKDKLTEYDIKRAEARYNIALKEVALENSRNNKTSMKLVRNEQGNWAYQYVANQDEIASKQQDLLDSWNDLYQLASDAYEKNLESSLNLQKIYLEQSKELAELMMSEDVETRELAIKRKTELDEWYLTKSKEYAEDNAEFKQDLEIATVGVLKTAYDQDKTNYESLTNEEKRLIDEVKDKHIKDYSEVETAVKTNLGNIDDKSKEVLSTSRQDWNSLAQQIINNWKVDNGASVTNTVRNGYGQIIASNADYIIELNRLQAVSGETFGKEGIQKNLSDSSAKTEELNNKTNDLADDMQERLPKAREQVDLLRIAYEQAVGVIDKATASIKEYINKVNEIPETKTTTITTKHVNKYVTEGSSSSGGSSGGGSSSSSGGSSGGSVKTNNLNKGGDPPKNNNSSKKYYIFYTDKGKNPTIPSNRHVLVDNLTKEQAQKYWNDHAYATKMKNANRGNDYYMKYHGENAEGGRTYDTGGYTGDWNTSEGRWAILHQKELVLNKEDTENFLSGINTIRDMTSLNGSISNSIAKAVANMMVTLSSKKVGNLNSGTEENTSNVFNITAEFPNAENVNEIRQAILSLPNLASQYIANNKK